MKTHRAINSMKDYRAVCGAWLRFSPANFVTASIEIEGEVTCKRCLAKGPAAHPIRRAD